MTFTIPDEIARRLAAAATARGVSVDDLLVEALTEWTAQHEAEPSDQSVIVNDEAPTDLVEGDDDTLEAFIGCGASGQSEPFDIHLARSAAAEAKLARGA